MGNDSREETSWMIGWCIGMIILQSLLLKIHRSGLSRPRSGQPSPAELFVAISVFWAAERSTECILAAIGAALSIGLSEFAGNNGYRNEDFHQHYTELGIGHMRPGSVWAEVSSLSKLIFISWNIHLGLMFVLDTGIPLLREVQKRPQKAIQRLELRWKELSRFVEATFRPIPNSSEILQSETSGEVLKTRLQPIHLQRHRNDNSSGGERRLSWSIVVDKDAMNEMKETLGPPGGFGELGFSVAKDGVRFEAMGVGTSFNLMFKLTDDDENIELGSKMKRKAVHFAK
ncbi:hypothetical protein N431DRAFT_429910 [Stipitochalara longipes BDJ]|nr:hypothetical protein N431DRAFT_429910 [Stipitochalara longipes BDJ]